MLVNAEMESAEKVNMPKLVQKIDASKKFQWSHNGGDVIKCSNFNWWKTWMEVGNGHTVNKPDLTSSSMDCTTKFLSMMGKWKLEGRWCNAKWLLSAP